ncbi:hypothetical protein [Aureivirga sp. CE67]|uniref:hypothetical protein n=1 Tax=Aureivirga sp. CE67 TaxID=1788983 RepID=UPI0018CAB81F|nr:hypothetical protein [Aureivirga sp. CE67]
MKFIKNTLVFAFVFLVTCTYAQDTNKNKGFFNITKISYINAFSSKEKIEWPDATANYDYDSKGSHAKSLQTINGFFLSERFSIGVGIGLDRYEKPGFNSIPLFADFRWYLSKEKNSFYAYTDLGMTIKTSSAPGGFMGNIGAGYKFNPFNKLFIVTDIFYTNKYLKSEEGSAKKTLNSNGVGISLGVLF